MGRALPREGRGKHELVFPQRRPEKSCPFFKAMGPRAVSLPQDGPAPSAKGLFRASPISEPPRSVGSSSNVTCAVVSRSAFHTARDGGPHTLQLFNTLFIFHGCPKSPVSCAYGELSSRLHTLWAESTCRPSDAVRHNAGTKCRGFIIKSVRQLDATLLFFFTIEVQAHSQS